jgi:hypothetical protein
MRFSVACTVATLMLSGLGCIAVSVADIRPSHADALSIGSPPRAELMPLKLEKSGAHRVRGRSVAARHVKRQSRTARRGSRSRVSRTLPGYGYGPSYRYTAPRPSGSSVTLPGPQVYTPPSLPPASQYYTTPGFQQYCATRYRTYDPTTNTQRDLGGTAQLCR